ncbi:MAG: glycosyltransferase [Bdellovibrionales bacterium]|nr:glycosyltransferase [Bdellovibrionales bacterium]
MNFLARETRSPPGASLSKSQLKISICIPHLNRSELLEKLLDELENQTRIPDEVVVVDDGSEQIHRERIHQIQKKKRPYRLLVIEQEKSGPRRARNQAANAASGDLLFFLDDDNLPLPSLCQKMLDAYLISGIPILTPVVEKVRDSDPSKMPTYWVPTGPCLELAAIQNHIGDMNALIEKKAFDQLGGLSEKSALACEDWEFFIRAHTQGIRMSVYPDPVFQYRDRAGSFLKRAPKILSELSALSALNQAENGFTSSVWTEFLRSIALSWEACGAQPLQAFSIQDRWEIERLTTYFSAVLQDPAILEFTDRSWTDHPVKREVKMAEYFCASSIPIRDAILLYQWIRTHKPSQVFEMGTCLGYSTAFLLAAIHQNFRENPLQCGKLISIEASDVLARHATQHLQRLGLWDERLLDLKIGHLQNVFPDCLSLMKANDPKRCVLVFEDAEHAGDAERSRFEAVLASVQGEAWFAYDDVSHDFEELSQFWIEIRKDHRVSSVVLPGRVGLVKIGVPNGISG